MGLFSSYRPLYTEGMSNYDRRVRKVTAGHVGTFGVTHEQIADAFRPDMHLDPGTPVNVLFGESGSMDREMYVSFTATGGGKHSNGRVIFQVVEASTRAWSGPAILLDVRIEV